MIRYLGNSLREFPGASNQTRCFAHTINLIAKSILKPFDGRKTKDLQEFNDTTNALVELDECDEQATGNGEGKEIEEDEDEDEDNDDEGLEPIKMTLLKVCLRLHLIGLFLR